MKKPQVLRRGGNPLVWSFQRAVAEWKFESEKVDEAEMVAFLTGHPLQECKSVLDEQPMPDLVPLLYLLVRMLQPKTVVETGVAAGRSSTSILLALEENGRGHLYSIDLPTTERLEDGSIYPLEGKPVGYNVPRNLRHRWELILGDSRRELHPLLTRLGEIDLFIHDSLHTERHMMWEFETAWPFLRAGGGTTVS
ncbi:class I SAM-dependent methyltransferase [Dehalococcoidia bacterium]|nr:class I SAM-dependent methyltransferase [Dehalococcoidia bacterium]